MVIGQVYIIYLVSLSPSRIASCRAWIHQIILNLSLIVKRQGLMMINWIVVSKLVKLKQEYQNWKGIRLRRGRGRPGSCKTGRKGSRPAEMLLFLCITLCLCRSNNASAIFSTAKSKKQQEEAIRRYQDIANITQEQNNNLKQQNEYLLAKLKKMKEK